MEKKEKEVLENLKDKKDRITSSLVTGDLVRIADKRKVSSRGDLTNCSCRVYTLSDIIDDTLPAYHINNLLERYNEALLKKTTLTLNENETLKPIGISKESAGCLAPPLEMSASKTNKKSKWNPLSLITETSVFPRTTE